jgi:hypothetical protein
MKTLILLLFSFVLSGQELYLLNNGIAICAKENERINCDKQPLTSLFRVKTDYSAIIHTTPEQINYYYPTNDPDNYHNEDYVHLEVISDTGNTYVIAINYKEKFITSYKIPYDNMIIYFYFEKVEYSNTLKE